MSLQRGISISGIDYILVEVTDRDAVARDGLAYEVLVGLPGGKIRAKHKRLSDLRALASELSVVVFPRLAPPPAVVETTEAILSVDAADAAATLSGEQLGDYLQGLLELPHMAHLLRAWLFPGQQGIGGGSPSPSASPVGSPAGRGGHGHGSPVSHGGGGGGGYSIGSPGGYSGNGGGKGGNGGGFTGSPTSGGGRGVVSFGGGVGLGGSSSAGGGGSGSGGGGAHKRIASGLPGQSYVVLHRWEAETDDDLDLLPGEIVTVLQSHPDGWWYGRKDGYYSAGGGGGSSSDSPGSGEGIAGYFPRNYVQQVLKETPLPPARSRSPRRGRALPPPPGAGAAAADSLGSPQERHTASRSATPERGTSARRSSGRSASSARGSPPRRGTPPGGTLGAGLRAGSPPAAAPALGSPERRTSATSARGSTGGAAAGGGGGVSPRSAAMAASSSLPIDLSPIKSASKRFFDSAAAAMRSVAGDTPSPPGGVGGGGGANHLRSPSRRKSSSPPPPKAGTSPPHSPISHSGSPERAASVASPGGNYDSDTLLAFSLRTLEAFDDLMDHGVAVEVDGSDDPPPVRGDLPEGSMVELHCTAATWDGSATAVKRYCSTRWPGEKTLLFLLGTGVVTEGLEAGLRRLSVGQRACIIVTPRLAYGEAGLPPFVPKNSHVVYQVEILAATAVPPPAAAAAAETGAAADASAGAAAAAAAVGAKAAGPADGGAAAAAAAATGVEAAAAAVAAEESSGGAAAGAAAAAAPGGSEEEDGGCRGPKALLEKGVSHRRNVSSLYVGRSTSVFFADDATLPAGGPPSPVETAPGGGANKRRGSDGAANGVAAAGAGGGGGGGGGASRPSSPKGGLATSAPSSPPKMAAAATPAEQVDTAALLAKFAEWNAKVGKTTGPGPPPLPPPLAKPGGPPPPKPAGSPPSEGPGATGAWAASNPLFERSDGGASSRRSSTGSDGTGAGAGGEQRPPGKRSPKLSMKEMLKSIFR